MNILYISNLSENIAAGLSWSIPASVQAQSKIDNVLWLNLTNAVMDHWKEIEAFHNLNEFGADFQLISLPKPFDAPDLVVFEGFYFSKYVHIASTLRKQNIPYVIVPRSSLTRQGQRNTIYNRLKKFLANTLMFNKYAKNALAIQYLTKAEQSDSGDKWNKNSFIVPNGFVTPKIKKETFSKNGIKIVYIGRLTNYQKGLDELLKACLKEKGYLEKNKITINLYGPTRHNSKDISDFIDKNDMKTIVSLHNEVIGKEKEQILLESDLFILPSRFEGHPMGLIEALSYGLPCLVSPGSNMMDEVLTEDAGWGCLTDANDIALKLRQVFDEKNGLYQKSINARNLSKRYNWDKIALDFHNKIKLLLS